MTDPNHYDNPNATTSPNRFPISKTVLGLGGAAVLLVTGAAVIDANRTPALYPSKPAEVVGHYTVPAHTELAGPVPVHKSTEYDIDVKQHEPGMEGADKQGNVTFYGVPVPKKVYARIKPGEKIVLSNVDSKDYGKEPQSFPAG